MKKLSVRAAALLLALFCMILPTAAAEEEAGKSAVSEALICTAEDAEAQALLAAVRSLAVCKGEALLAFSAGRGTAEDLTAAVDAGRTILFPLGVTQISALAPEDYALRKAVRIYGEKVHSLPELAAFCEADFDIFCLRREVEGVSLIDCIVQEKAGRGLLSSALTRAKEENGVLISPAGAEDCPPVSALFAQTAVGKEDAMPRLRRGKASAEEDALTLYAAAVPTVHFLFAQTENGTWKHVLTADDAVLCMQTAQGEKRSFPETAFFLSDSFGGTYGVNGLFASASQIFREKRTAVCDLLYGCRFDPAGEENAAIPFAFAHPETPGDLYDALTRTNSTPAELLMICVSVCVIVFLSVLMMHRTPRRTEKKGGRDGAAEN